MSRLFKPVISAIAVLCLPCTGALAQSSVSLYGLLDVSAGQFQDAGASKEDRVQSGGMRTSFLGFSGKEALSDTLKATFAIESYLQADTGASGRFAGDAFWARAAWVGLEGDFGATTLGRTTSPYFVSTAAFNAFGDSVAFSPAIRLVFAPKPQMLPFLADTAWNNSILYASSPAGTDRVSVNLQGALGEGSATTTGNSFGANLLYGGDRISATVAYQRVKHGLTGTLPAVVATGFEYQQAATAGVSYDAGAVKLFAQYHLVRTKASARSETRYVGLGAAVPAGLGKVSAQYGQATADLPAAPDLRNKTLSVGYDHMLSKRTDVYAVYVNDRLTGASNGNTFALGLRHQF